MLMAGISDMQGQAPVSHSLSNTSPVEGCDVITFTVDVCNNSASARQAIVRVIDMEYFEIANWGDFDVGNPADDFVEKDLGTMDPYACEQLQFQAIAMRQINFTSNPPGPVVRAGVKFVLGGVEVNHNTSASCTTQGFKVLDGRSSPYSIAGAIQAQELPDPGDACDDEAKALGKLTMLGTVALDIEDIYCIGWITAADIRMGEGAELLIEHASTLLLRGNVGPCQSDEMWRQIHVESGGKLVYNHHISEYGTIRNAARALSLAGGSWTELSRVNFVNNHVGIYMDGYEEGFDDSAPHVPIFTDLTFRNDLDGDLWGTVDTDLKAWDGADAGKPFAGVVAVNCEIVRLGSPIYSETNSYLDLPNGVFAFNSSVEVGPSFFARIYGLESITAPDGYAVYSRSNQNRYLRVEGANTSDPVIIQDADFGIRSVSNLNVDILNVNMNNVKEGIFTSAFSPQTRVRVEHCELENMADRGILHRGQAELSYRNNAVQMKDLDDQETIKGFALETNPVLKHWHQALDVTGNSIDLHTGQGGILSWVSKGVIQENSIEMHTSNNAVLHGISWQHPFDASIRCNLIEGTSYSGLSYTDGIYLAGSNHTETSCNDADKVGAGIRLFGMNTGKAIRANTLRDHQLGLAYGYPNAANQTISGQQHFRGNLWTVLHKNATVFGRYGAIHYGSNQTITDQSKYLVNDGSVQEFMPIWSAVGQWFESDINDENQDCNEDITPLCEMGPGVSVPMTPDDLDERIMQDSMPYPEWAYAGGRRLLLRANVYPELMSDSAVNAYCTTAMTGYLGSWHEVEEDVRLAWKADSSLQAVIGINLEELTVQRMWIREVTDSLVAALTGEDSAFWQLRLDTAYLDYRMLWSERQLLADSVEALALGRLEDAWSKNDTLTANEIWEENEKAVRAMALTLVLERRDTLSSQELSDLEDIADQCPTWGGDAVWHARSMLRGFGDYYWDDEAICDEAEPIVSGLISFVSTFSVIPNPASEYFQVWANADPGSSMLLVDLYGRVLRTDIYTGQGHIFSLRDLLPGPYLIRMIDSSNNPSYCRLQVLR